MTKKKESVIRPGDIPIKTDRYKTVLSPVVSDLAVSILINPPKIGVRPPLGKPYYRTKTFRQIEERKKKVDGLLKKYEGVK